MIKPYIGIIYLDGKRDDDAYRGCVKKDGECRSGARYSRRRRERGEK